MRSPSARPRITTSLPSVPGAIACTAFISRFTNTWPSRASSAAAGGSAAPSPVTRARCLKACSVAPIAQPIARPTSAVPEGVSAGRENNLRSATILPIRQPAAEISVWTWATRI